MADFEVYTLKQLRELMNTLVTMNDDTPIVVLLDGERAVPVEATLVQIMGKPNKVAIQCTVPEDYVKIPLVGHGRTLDG